MSVYVAANPAAGAPVGFTVSGTGTVPLDNNAEGNDAGGAAAQTQNPADATNRPGGGLGTPVNTPDPLFKYRWWIIAVVALGLVAGAAYTMSNSGSASAQSANAVAAKPTSVVDMLKEELFQLESDRLQNKISSEEYAKAKAAMDVLMVRVSSRQS
jgi:hypothetical protein